MSDLLTAVKSVRSQPKEPSQSKELKPIYPTADKTTAVAQNPSNGDSSASKQVPASADEALLTLRSRPDLHTLLATLKQLRSHALQPDFNIHSPGPLQAQIIHTLLAVTVPDFWGTLQKRHASHLTTCLSNVAGLNAIFARLRLLSSQASKGQDTASGQVSDLLELAEEMLVGSSTLLQVHADLTAAVPDTTRRDLSWKEVVTLIGSGKIPSILAQAEDVVKTSSGSTSDLANGGRYADWLGRNTATLVIHGSDSSAIPAASQVIAKSMGMGYPNQLLLAILQTFAKAWRDDQGQKAKFTSMMRRHPASAKQTFLEYLLRWLSTITDSDVERHLQESATQTRAVSTLAALLSLLVADERFASSLTLVLTDPTQSSLLSHAVRRACVLTLANLHPDCDEIQTILEKLMSIFNDRLFIAHAPIIQQESLAQTILLGAGYLHRQLPMALLMTARSSNHMQGVSDRLDSSNTRARWLGMVVGTAISGLVDKAGMKISFGTEEMESQDAKRYRGLVSVHDTVGDLDDLEGLISSREQRPRRVVKRTEASAKLPIIDGKQAFGPPRPPAQTEVIGEKVTEILASDDDDEDDDLKPYAKPDSDPEDSDEDATLVNRKKPKPPVYVRDLMAMLRDDQDHDRFQLGIKHAAALIRRKTNFGSEVKDHAEEIGVILCNLHDPFETDDFETMKLQAMIAVILSDVKVMAPWFCGQAFSGDYSLAQRCIILSSLGLSGRELAGLKDEDDLNMDVDNSSFPSKVLPPRLHAIYSQPSPSTKRLDAASQDVEHALIKPLALQAADKSTAHLNAVKVRSFSSRTDAERTKRKPRPNELARVFGQVFFFPLINRYQQEIAAYGAGSVFGIPFVLVTFIKTLALLLHATGPATLGLSELSGEFWDLLLSLRTQASQDITELHAVLFSLLTILELNTDQRRVVQEHPRRLMETQEWVELVFDRMGGSGTIGGDGRNEEDKIKTLAAGVLVKTKEIIGAYQKNLVGYEV